MYEASTVDGLRLLRAVAILALIMVAAPAIPVRAQQTPAADPFAGLHQRLTAVADGALNAAERVPRRVEPAPAEAAPVPAPQDWLTAGTPALRRVQQLRPTLEPILRAEGVPPQLASVVLVESGGHPQALSPKGARGLWQFMPDTARRYGLTVSPQRDDRLDAAKSTRAAARYLRDLYAHFGSWPLALAAYNAGEHTVLRAQYRAAARDIGARFIDLSQSNLLPAETRGYVPAVLASWNLFRPATVPTLATTGLRLYASMSSAD